MTFSFLKNMLKFLRIKREIHIRIIEKLSAQKKVFEVSNDFELSKNLTRSENNFVGLSK